MIIKHMVIPLKISRDRLLDEDGRTGASGDCVMRCNGLKKVYSMNVGNIRETGLIFPVAVATNKKGCTGSVHPYHLSSEH
jgi:hypothetical protein